MTEPTIASRGPELVFALVSPIGTPIDSLRRDLEEGLHSYGYATEWLKLSGLLTDQAERLGLGPVPVVPEHQRAEKLMEAGDRLCEVSQSAAAVALEAVNEIRRKRDERALKSDVEAADGSLAVPRQAWILDSLKRPAEVMQLRLIYGDHLFVISAQAGRQLRENTLREKIAPYNVSLRDENLDDVVNRLVTRDLDEEKHGGYGQNILKTFPMADVFIDVDEAQPENPGVPQQVRRLLDLIFGNPNYPVPTDEEYGMQLAFLASTRSPELGLKVGAAVTRGTTVVSLGANAHPTKLGSSPAYDTSSADIRHLILDTLNRLMEPALGNEAVERLVKEPDLFVDELLRGPLKGSRIVSLTEFQPTVHAEMAAVLDAVSQGQSVAGAIVYVTTYPCHGCAKHLLRLALPVKYIEPYPKGRAQAMYGGDVEDSFEPFTGVAPRRYHQLFTATEDRKDPWGVRRSWSAAEKLGAEPNVDPLLDHAGINVREQFALAQLAGSGGPIDTSPAG
ncbi:MAG TPA: hypothetical protein VFP89_13810 [Propionibacteriaceae bacterium]|nr:hypothetical protein [Propionibacteriaceae bacterium]